MGKTHVRCAWTENAVKEHEAFKQRVHFAAESLTGEKIERLTSLHYRLVALDYIAHLALVSPDYVSSMAEREPRQGTTWAEHCIRNGITKTEDNPLGIDWKGYFAVSEKSPLEPIPQAT